MEDRDPAPGEENMTMVQYTTKEIWCRNEDRRIYGIAYIPEAEGQILRFLSRYCPV